MNVLDINAGIGGMAIGFESAGHKIIALYEENPISIDILKENFAYVICHIPENISEIPHPDIICGTLDQKSIISIKKLIPVIRPRLVVFRLIKKIDTSMLSEMGYHISTDKLDAFDFGVCQRRKETYCVGFRKDVKKFFLSFPFPDSNEHAPSLKNVLEDHPEDSLVVSPKLEEYLKQRDNEGPKRGVRFKSKVLIPEDLFPFLSTSVSKGESPLLNNEGVLRRFSKLELVRAMGFPDSYKLNGSYKSCVSRLCSEPCPPVVRSIATEIIDWV